MLFQDAVLAGRLLELELKQNWDTEAQKMQDHITQMATLTQSSIGEMEARSARCGEACSAGRKSAITQPSMRRPPAHTS